MKSCAVNKDNLNGQVVRVIGKTAVGSRDLIVSVDSKFEIVRNMEKILKDAVKTNKVEGREEVEESEAPVNSESSTEDALEKV